MKTHKNTNTAEKPQSEHTETEHPVYITTFKSVQNEDGETTIQTENKRVSQEEGIVVEEVLSDTEPIAEETIPSNVEITEVSEPTGDFLIYNTNLYKYMHTRFSYTRITKSTRVKKIFSNTCVIGNYNDPIQLHGLR